MALNRVTSTVVSSLAIVVVSSLGVAIVQIIGARFVRLVHSVTRLREGLRQQLLTLVQILRWLTSVLIVGAGVLMLLSTFGFDITPVLAGAGVAGLAVSLGAQTIIKDFIGGLLILLENQFVVGEKIKVGAVSGQVERLTLRATHIRDSEGNLHIVPNGEVRIVCNQTR